MASALNALTIKGFKSILELDNFKLESLNVLIGANGAGKSNFIEIFRMLRAMVDQDFANYILRNGGSDDFLFNGPKKTSSIFVHFFFGQNEYKFELVPTVSEKFVIKQEAQKYELGKWDIMGSDHYESQLAAVKDKPGLTAEHGVGHYVYQAISDWTVYHFHDTSANAPMRRSEIVEDNKQLRSDAANLAPFLLYLKTQQEKHYQEIVNTIQLVAPFFDDFILEVVKKGEKDTV
ncbi:MAG: AAA family ATPase, partial [Gammaproteobacteria bacterium]|nr:AAA family ATPase [Gammaproteobacteria bacterium]